MKSTLAAVKMSTTEEKAKAERARRKAASKHREDQQAYLASNAMKDLFFVTPKGKGKGKQKKAKRCLCNEIA